MTFARPFLLAALLATAAGGGIATARAQSASAGEKLQPQFSPTFTTGQTFGFQASVRLDSTYRIVELKKAFDTANITTDTLDNSRVNYDLELTTEGALAKSVFSNGTLREVDFVVKRLEITQSDGKTTTLAPAGAILGARELDDGRPVFAINGKTPAKEVANYLGYLIQLGDPHVTDRQLFGPAAATPVGGSWILNPRLLLGSNFAQVFSGALQAAGSMSLQGVQRDNAGRLVATVKGDFRLSGVKAPFPAQVKAKPSLVEYQYQATAPVTADAGEHKLHLTTKINHEGVTGNISAGFSESQIKMSINVEQSADYTIDPARPRIAALAAAPSVPYVAPQDAAPSAMAAPFVSRDELDAEKNKAAGTAPAGKSPGGAAAATTPRTPANSPAGGGLSLSSQSAPGPAGNSPAANVANPPATNSATPMASLPTLNSAAATSPFAGALPLNPSVGGSARSGAQPLPPSANTSPLTGATPLTPASVSGNGTLPALPGATPLTPVNSSPFAGALPLLPTSGNKTAP